MFNAIPLSQIALCHRAFDKRRLRVPKVQVVNVLEVRWHPSGLAILIRSEYLTHDAPIVTGM